MFSNQHFREICWHYNIEMNICIGLFFYTHCTPLNLCVIALNLLFKLSALHVTILEENIGTQCYGTAVQNCKNTRLRVKTAGVNTHWHSSLHLSNLQLQNQVALMSCRIQAVEHRRCAAGLAEGGFTQNPVTAYDTAYGQQQSSHKLVWPYPGEFSRFRPASGLLKILLSKPNFRCWCSCCM